MKHVGSYIGITLLLITGLGCSRTPTGPGGNGWTFEPVAMGLQVGLHSALTTTSDGAVHILHHNADELSLYHARRRAPRVWESVRVDSVGWKGRDVALSRGPGDTLHAAWQDIFVKDLRYAAFDGTIWRYDRLDPWKSAGAESIIEVRGDGIHLLELMEERSRIQYWIGGAGDWTLTGEITISRPRSVLALAWGPTGPAIAGFASSTSSRLTRFDLRLFTASDPAGTWTKSTLIHDLQRDDFTYQSLAMEYDEVGIRHILFRRGNGDLIDLADGRVAREVAEGRVRIGRDPAGILWTLYPFEDGFGLSSLQPGGWRRETTITDLDPLGKWALHIDEAGTFHVSFYDHSRHRLWYGRWEP